jgi:hypothetical protein
VGAYEPVDRTETPAQMPFFPLHAQGFGSAAFVVVPAEMQHAVNQQRDDFLVQGSAASLRLALGDRQGDDHITEMRAGLAEVMRCPTLSKGESEDVRRPVFVPEQAVEPPHPPITDERDAQICRRLAD